MNTLNFVQNLLEDGVRDGVYPSAVAAVGRGSETLFIGAAGDATPDTRFDMASLSKVLSTTMLALRAIEEGDLTLFDTVSRFFDAPADKADINIFQLMTHTGGFTPAFWLSEFTDDPDRAAECILARPLEAEPDGTPRYSCMGYLLLGKILEKVYGAPLNVLAETRVFAPLGMKSTGYCPAPGNIAPTEVDPETGKAWCGIVHDENARFLRGVSGNAGVFSNIHDMLRFGAMLANEGDGFLSPATLRKATRNYTAGYDAHRGLGFHLGGTPYSFMGDLFPDNSFGHTGFTGTTLVVDPATRLFVVLLTNHVHPTRNNEKVFRFRRVLHNRIYAACTK